jgi:hypothetical protein
MPQLLTPHFSAEELGVVGCEQRLIDNATFLCATILEPIRQHFQKSISIHDGYRDPDHNARVGGKDASYHLFAGGKAAVDIEVAGYTYRQVFDWIRLQSKLPFDKIILEHTAAGYDATVHIQIDRTATPRRQSFTGGTGDSKQYILVETR